MPKVRPKGVIDGKQVNIPAPMQWSEAGVEKGSWAGYWIPVKVCREILLVSPQGR